MPVTFGVVTASVKRIRWLVLLFLVILLLAAFYSSEQNESKSNDETRYLLNRVRSLESQVAMISKLDRNEILQPDVQTKRFLPVKFLTEQNRKRILVTGGAGFVGSHLVDELMKLGHEVTVIDNFFTGRKRNVEHWVGHPNFELINHDVVERIMIEVDEIYHLACPASPPHYMYNPIKTIKTSSIGTMNLLGLAKRIRAKFLLASTSEVYGDPKEHPQKEDYWGNVNPIGPRACYDEGKRVAETMCISYEKQDKVRVRIARIFNTYGPRMHMADGRVVSNFILQALRGESLTVYGKGHQTRSFQYVSDLVNGLIKLMDSDVSTPVNLVGSEVSFRLVCRLVLIPRITPLFTAGLLFE
jgi:UDP-glucuronate decarboxylase